MTVHSVTYGKFLRVQHSVRLITKARAHKLFAASALSPWFEVDIG